MLYWQSLDYKLVKKHRFRLSEREFLHRTDEGLDVLVFNHGRGYDNYGVELRFNSNGSFHSHWVGML